MPAIPRPFIAASAAVVGTSAIALSPVAVTPPNLYGAPVIQAVQLTASTDWSDIYSRAGESANKLIDIWRQAPAPILEQIIANQISYLKQLPNFAGIAGQIQDNLQSAFAAPTAPDTSTLDGTHRTFYNLLPAIEQLPGIPELLQLKISPTGKQLLAFATTSLSGVLVGFAGPIVGPLLVLASGLESIRTDLGAATPDVAAAMSTLAGIPAAMTDAFLNGGQHVDLTALVKAVGPSIGVSFPDGVQVGIALGGLLSPGGSAFNALDFSYDNNLLGLFHIHVPLATGTPAGPIGSMMELGRAIAKAIGWQEPSSAAAAKSTAAKSLVAANEVPSSVVNSDTPTVSVPVSVATAAKAPAVKADKAIRAVPGSGSADRAAKKSPASAGSGKASSARAKSARAAG